MNRIIIAFRSFFALLFSGALPDDIVTELGLSRRSAPKPAAAPAPAVSSAADGALQILGILQRGIRGGRETRLDDPASIVGAREEGLARHTFDDLHAVLFNDRELHCRFSCECLTRRREDRPIHSARSAVTGLTAVARSAGR